MAGIIGLIVGGAIDQSVRMRRAGGQGQQGQRRQANGGQSFEDIFSYYRQQTQRYDFPTQLLVLSAYVMKSDGKVVKAELDFVKTFLAAQFGPQFNVNHLQTLKRFLDSPSLPIEEICNDIRMRSQVEMRIQLLHYLFGIAQADGQVSELPKSIPCSELLIYYRFRQWISVR